MARKPIIYKQQISVSDLERNFYNTLHLTLALHPSETTQRLMARVLAYVINAQDRLVFTKGLNEIDQPDIWIREMDEQISLWIDVGEPSVERIKKATRQAEQVKVYSFNSKSDIWWQQNQQDFVMLQASVFRFNVKDINSLADLLTRTMDYSVTITNDSAYIATEQGECEVTWQALQLK